MGRVNLEGPCPKNVALHPDPDWSFDSLLSELSLYEKKPTYILKVSDNTAAREVSQSKHRHIPKANRKDGVSKAFVVRVSDEECKIDDDYVDEKPPVAGWRLGCGELFLSDSEESEDDLIIGSQNKLMPPVGFVEATLSEITKDRQLSITDEIRSQKMDLETSLMIENEKYAFDLARTMNQAEAKLEAVKRYDMQYQRELAGALDTHMVAIQRDREHKSQIEERKIRDDAAREEAQKRERASREEKLRQEKIEAEAQARLEAERAEAAKAATLEAERRAAEETAQKNTSTLAGTPTTGRSENKTEAMLASQDKKIAKSTGNLIKGAETALNLEVQRLKIYEELSAENQTSRMRSNVNISALERQMKRNIRTLTGEEDNVSMRAGNLWNLMNQPSLPKSISIMTFVDLIVAQCDTSTDSSSLYAYGHCAVFLSSKVPHVMDILIAKLNKVCIYTVPKHISYSKSAFESNDAYYKAIGYQQKDDGKIESTDSFLGRMTSFMKLYGAIVQTEVQGIQNPHGLEESWLWLSRFLNSMPPNQFTAVALYSFLEMAGYAMHRRFRRQFVKMVGIISRDFVDALPDNVKSNATMVSFRNYLKSKEYLNEPKERVKRVYVLSRDPEL